MILRVLPGLVVAVVLLLPCAGPAARADAAATETTALVATDDGTVSSSRPSTTFGAGGTLLVGARPVVRSYVKFDLSSIDGAVTRAVLRLTATSAGRGGFGVREVADASWSERTLTYANAPPLARPAALRAGGVAAGRTVSLDVTASVASGVRSFALVGRGGSTAIALASSEARSVAARPRLVVTHTRAGPPPGPCGTAASRPHGVDHVIWIWMENKPYGAVIGSPSAPFANELAASCGLATNYHGVAHPSLPNYVAATSGSTHGITDDASPSAHPLDGPSIYSQLRAAGKTWRDYEEGAPGPCPLAPSGSYAVKHDPAPYYTGIRADCALWDVPMGTTAGGNFLTDLTYRTLPTFSFVTPDLCNDTHDCPVETGDAWLRSWFARILASPTYRDGRTVIFVAWDEDDDSGANRVPLIVVSPSTPAGTASEVLLDHYALLKTTEQLLGLSPFLGHAGDAGTASMVSSFNLG